MEIELKIEVPSKNFRIIRAVLLLVAVGLMAYVAYAATQLTVSNSGTLVTGPANLFLALGQTSTTSCTTSTVGYADTGLSITGWTVSVLGPPSNMYACLENTGTAAHTLAISGSGFPTGVTFSSAENGSTVGAAGAILVTFTLTATTNATPGPFSGATITIT